MAAGTTPAFLRLSEELLTMIAEHFCTEGDAPNTAPRQPESQAAQILQLKWLRSIHARFAYLAIVQRELFATIHLTPRVQLPDIRALTNISSNVQRVVFHAPEFWPDIADCQSPTFKTMMISSEDHAMQELAFVEKCIDKGPIVPLYAKVLKALPNLRTAVIARWPSARQEILTSLLSRMDAKGHDCTRFQFYSLSGKATFELFLRCFALAKLSIQELRIENEGNHFGWDILPHWHDLDLSNLTSLQFCCDRRWRLLGEDGDGQRAENELMDHGQISWRYKVQISPRIWRREPEASFFALLSRCAATLQYLTIDCANLYLWPEDSPVERPDLPLLKQFEIAQSTVEPASLGHWIMSSPLLQSLALHSTKSPSRIDGLDDWKPLFQSIREHPKTMRLHLRFHMRPSNALSDTEIDECALIHDTSKPGDDELLQEWSRIGPAQMASLKNYLSNAAEWDSVLEAYSSPMSRWSMPDLFT